jgi:hypothetical protein
MAGRRQWAEAKEGERRDECRQRLMQTEGGGETEQSSLGTLSDCKRGYGVLLLSLGISLPWENPTETGEVSLVDAAYDV